MNKPAAMAGVYVDMKFMPGLKMARISIEIPIEHSNEFIRMFGTPDRTDPVAVGIARLNAAAVPEKAEPAAPSVKAEKAWSPSQVAALKLQDPEFRLWLSCAYPDEWDRAFLAHGNDAAKVADVALKDALGISSKTVLDVDGAPALAAWNRLLASFDYRNQVRA